jgi:DNA invertase Pin-like site-specific DNA recombinase
MQIGYARVSSVRQNLDRQLGALNALRCDPIFSEKALGKSLKGHSLIGTIARLDTRDVLVLAEWDRATRSLMDGIRIMQRVHARGRL